MLCNVRVLARGSRGNVRGIMLDVEKFGGNVEKKSNERNGLTVRVCGRFCVSVIKLIEKKSIWGVFSF